MAPVVILQRLSLSLIANYPFGEAACIINCWRCFGGKARVDGEARPCPVTANGHEARTSMVAPDLDALVSLPFDLMRLAVLGQQILHQLLIHRMSDHI